MKKPTMVTMRFSIVGGIAATLLTCAGLCADSPSRDELAAKLAKAFPPGTFTDEQVVRANVFEVTTLNYRELSRDLALTDAKHAVARISVDRGPPLTVGVDRGPNTIGVEILDARTQETLVAVGKRDSDNRLNDLRYTVVDDAGKPTLEVFDYEMDGQADVRMHYGSARYTEIWHANRWLRIERGGQGRGVHVDGQFKKVESKDGRLYVETP